ncbi:hypothetical protein [Promicromonospora soli]
MVTGPVLCAVAARQGAQRGQDHCGDRVGEGGAGPGQGLAFALLRAREQTRVQLRAGRRRPEEGAYLFGSETELGDRVETINGRLYALKDQQ